LLKKIIFLRLLKNARMQGARNPRSEAYLKVRRNEKDEGNPQMRFSAAYYGKQIF